MTNSSNPPTGSNPMPTPQTAAIPSTPATHAAESDPKSTSQATAISPTPAPQIVATPLLEVSNRIKKKLIIWTTFSVFIGSLPVILNMLILYTDSKPIHFFDLFAHGELLLISVAIAADAVGDMIYSKKFEEVKHILYLCICFVIISISISWFASLGIGGAATNTSGFGTVSLVLFVSTIFVSGNCKAQVEVPNVSI